MLNVFYNEKDNDVIKKGYEIENNIQQETLHSHFDIEKHKQVFVNYLEVIIDKEGVVHYAVPSHQEWLIKKAIEILDIDRVDLYDECPDEYCFDIMSWLTDVTECVSVWNDRYIGKPNNKQISTLTNLYNNKLYNGTLPIKKLTDEQRESLLEPNSYHCGVLSSVERVARITLCGCVHFDINDNMGFIKPTPEQIKNLHDNFCIDVELFDVNE